MIIKEIKAPTFVAPSLIPFISQPTLFTAGGITGCTNWQEQMVKSLRNRGSSVGPSGIIIFNPRRDDFDTSKAEMTEEQIEWEYTYLRLAKAVSFWFPKETLCPITLFELGSALERKNQQIFIGCDPDYGRVTDVIKQVQLARRDIKQISFSIEDLCFDIEQNINTGEHNDTSAS